VKNWHLILDFDSTIVDVEALEVLADFALASRSDKQDILDEVARITRLGMEGGIAFDDSLRSRLCAFTASIEHVNNAGSYIASRVSPSIADNHWFFKEHKDRIHVVSGGFDEFILPVAENIGFKPDNVYANAFIFSPDGFISGVDTSRHLAHDKGKVHAVKSLDLSGLVIVVGDGYTDYHIKESGVADYFIAYIENVHRTNVVEKADAVAHNFTDVIDFLHQLELV
jgi:D-3-phosphoglycerate dehydrogenase